MTSDITGVIISDSTFVGKMNGPIYSTMDNEGLANFPNYLVSSSTTQLRNFSNVTLGRAQRRYGRMVSGTKGVSRMDIAHDIAASAPGIAWFKNVRQLARALEKNHIFQSGLSTSQKQIIDIFYRARDINGKIKLDALQWFSLVLFGFSQIDIDSLYRKVEPKLYGENIVVADLDTEYHRKRESRVYDKVISNVSIRSKTGKPTEHEIRDAYIFHLAQHREVHDSKATEEFPMSITIRTIHDVYPVQPKFNWAERAHFGSSLSYMSATPTTVQISAMEQLNTNSERKCAYLIVSEDLKMTEAEISAFVNKPVEAGLTPVDLRNLYAARNASLYLFDLNDTIIDHVTIPAEDRSHNECGERVFLIILANEHAFRPGLEMRERLMKVTPEKRPEPKESKDKTSERGVIYRGVDSYWEAEELARKHTINYDWRVTERHYDAEIHAKDVEIKAIWNAQGYRPESKKKCKETRELEKQLKTLEKTKKKAIEFSKLEAARNQKIVNIYVLKSNLNEEYKSLVCDLGYVYASNIDSKLDVTHIKYADYVNIYANTEPVELQTTAHQLEIDYANQTIPALGRRAFKTFRKNRWESSILSTAMVRLLELFPANAWNREYLTLAGENEECAAVDFYRNYTSIARSGEFYVAPLMADLTPYDGHIPGEFPALYYVETKEAQLFDGNGIYDYQVVAHGLALGLIVPDCIKLYVKCVASPMVDDTLKQYIDKAYSSVMNDSHRKGLVNTLIGSFGTMHKFGKRKAFVVDSLVEASYYYRTNDTTHPRISQLGYVGNDPVYVATAEDMLYRRKSDELIRRAIVQRGRMHTYNLMLAVSKQFKVVQIKTDAVYYIKPVDAKPFVAENNGIFGSTRTEKLDEHVRTQRGWNNCGDVGSMATYEHMNQKWNEPFGNLSRSKPFDAMRLVALNRAFIEGQAGTGKSFILRSLSDALESKGLRVKRCAFTHAAANIINGTTCHKLFGINIIGGVSEKQLRAVMADVDAVLIDEMSMVPECIYNVLSQLPGHVRVYGFGDFNQHRPVEDQSFQAKSYRETSMFKSIFDYKLITLRKQFRANANHAAACMNFFKAAETVGVEDAMIVFPSEIKRVGPDEPLPKLNICYTNEKRRALNIRVAEAQKMPHSSPNKRQPMSYNNISGGCYYTEKYDARKLMYIIKHPEEFADIFAKAHQGAEDPLVIATKYFANSIFDDNGFGYKRVEYHRGTEGKGRWIPTGSQSLSYITRGVRHIISNQFYIDIDCVNCHPMILKQLCEKNGIAAPRLNNYILNRDAVLQEVMNKCKCDRDAAKKVFLAVINGGEADYKKLRGDKCKVLREFKFEMSAIASDFESKNAELYNKHIERRRMNNKYEGSDDGAFVNMFMLEIEAKILDVIVGHMKRLKLLGASGNEVVLCADGLMVPRSNKITPELLRDLEHQIRRNLNFEMKLEFKPMNPKELPAQLPKPKKTKEMAGMMDPRLWDEFTHIGPGMPVIANETNNDAQYSNNERFTIHMIANGLVTLEDANNIERRVVLEEARFRRDFRPAYAITSHKAQGATIRETYGIHELVSMGSNGAYVAITRTADPKCVILFE